MKIVARYCEENDLMDLELAAVLQMDLPFDLSLLPRRFPPLGELRLWVGGGDGCRPE